MVDSLGDRMKMYEGMETERRFLPLLPICARMDGKGFSRFTRGLAQPFDPRLTELMRETTRYLVQETQACMGYTQSDEITLVWYSAESKSQIFFDRRIQKMTSVLASMTTSYFSSRLDESLPEKAGQCVFFDARVWQLPNKEEAANVFLWREFDATKNSVSMAARTLYSHAQLQKKTSSEMQEMLWQKGVNWNDYPAAFKRGTYFQRRTVTRAFTSEERQKLPPKHAAHRNPDLMIERTEVRPLEMPPFSKVNNRVEVIFSGATPQLAEE